MRASSRSRFTELVRTQWAGLLALFLVIAGGTAYAANTIGSSDIINDSIRSIDVRDDTLTGGGLGNADLKAGSVRSSEVAADSLTGADIANQSLTATDLAADSVGFDELQFGTLPDYTYTNQANSANDTTVIKEQQASCVNAGDEAVGGGYVITGATPDVFRSYAVDANSWLVRAAVASGTPTWQLAVVVNCIG
jgi:hypothetical protein